MKFTIMRESLLEPLQMISGAVERRNQQAILSHVLLSVKTHQLDLTATDLEVELQARVTLAQPAQTGEITVPARKFIDICRMLPDETEISIHQTKTQLIISAGRGRYALSTLDASEFPQFDLTAGEQEFEMTQSSLHHLLDRTAFSMAQQDVRFYLNGMLLFVENGEIRTVATDGHRLASSVNLHPDDKLPETQVIIPRKGVVELLRLIDPGSDDTVGITLNSRHIRVQSNAFSMVSKLIDGKYPDHRAVIPSGGDKSLMVDRDSLKNALTRVAILSNEKVKGIRINLSTNALKLSTNNPEHEQAEELLEVDYGYSDLEMGFNVNYMIDVLSHIPPGKVKFTFSDASSSALIESCEDKSCLFVIMPLRL